jgi:hypothetical protein
LPALSGISFGSIPKMLWGTYRSANVVTWYVARELIQM